MKKITKKARKCQRTACKKEATWKYKHDLGCTIYRCDAHMEGEYKMTGTRWF